MGSNLTVIAPLRRASFLYDDMLTSIESDPTDSKSKREQERGDKHDSPLELDNVTFVLLDTLDIHVLPYKHSH